MLCGETCETCQAQCAPLRGWFRGGVGTGGIYKGWVQGSGTDEGQRDRDKGEGTRRGPGEREKGGQGRRPGAAGRGGYGPVAAGCLGGEDRQAPPVALRTELQRVTRCEQGGVGGREGVRQAVVVVVDVGQGGVDPPEGRGHDAVHDDELFHRDDRVHALALDRTHRHHLLAASHRLHAVAHCHPTRSDQRQGGQGAGARGQEVVQGHLEVAAGRSGDEGERGGLGVGAVGHAHHVRVDRLALGVDRQHTVAHPRLGDGFGLAGLEGEALGGGEARAAAGAAAAGAAGGCAAVKGDRVSALGARRTAPSAARSGPQGAADVAQVVVGGGRRARRVRRAAFGSTRRRPTGRVAGRAAAVVRVVVVGRKGAERARDAAFRATAFRADIAQGCHTRRAATEAGGEDLVDLRSVGGSVGCGSERGDIRRGLDKGICGRCGNPGHFGNDAVNIGEVFVCTNSSRGRACQAVDCGLERGATLNAIHNRCHDSMHLSNSAVGATSRVSEWSLLLRLLGLRSQRRCAENKNGNDLDE